MEDLSGAPEMSKAAGRYSMNLLMVRASYVKPRSVTLTYVVKLSTACRLMLGQGCLMALLGEQCIST